INALKSAYKALFESGEPLQERAEELLKETNTPSVKNLLAFITTSKRGIPFIRKNING
ncbi:MAG: acyl-[acyl-carrier-protein]--UDP-N-acetylglucosamine O-acyltransferase, partial [Epsilonproteobacteria bacterium]|nr:acyl-[acyl-carrier-protein]--UDP-N-acetylglucosamine O-acyltransferase [Campylobacterota bacterium]